jgi:predicted nucleotidyltransferase
LRNGIRGTDNRVLRVCRLLNKRRARYLIAGGVAANLHGSVRATKDVDILVPKDVDNTQLILDALGELPYGIARELDASEVTRKPFTIVGDDPRVDILTIAHTVKFDAASSSAIVRRIDGVRVQYLSLKDLIASKQTGRARDLADLEVLRGLLEGQWHDEP